MEINMVFLTYRLAEGSNLFLLWVKTDNLNFSMEGKHFFREVTYLIKIRFILLFLLKYSIINQNIVFYY